jgi:arylsulfatase
MELYAAMVGNLDFHVGRLLDYLREVGEYHETVVVFLSDNGAEPGDRGPAGMDERDREWYAEQFPDTDLERWGRPGVFVEYGAAWAQVSMVPFRLFKGTLAEGGIRSPLIISGPAVGRLGRGMLRDDGITRAVLHVTDVVPTLLELAGAQRPESWKGRKLAPLAGGSLVPLLERSWWEREAPREWLGFEYAGDRAVRRGSWKAVWMPPPFGAAKWRLYRIDRDPAELYDRAEARPAELAQLEVLWRDYAQASGARAAEAPPASPEAR